MKNNRWILCFMLCLGMLLGIIPLLSVPVTAASNTDGWLWPVPGVTSLFRGYYSESSGSHLGIDISSPAGKPVVASKSGWVYETCEGCHNKDANYSKNPRCTSSSVGCHPITKTWDKSSGKITVNTNPNYYTNSTCNGGTGNGVRIMHEDGTYTKYSHLLNIVPIVEPGQWVEQGEVIGYVGSSGNSFGAHLHFSIATDNKFNNNINTNPIGSQYTNNDSTHTFTRNINYLTEASNSSYLSRCTYYPAYFTVKVTTAAPLWSLPCSNTTDSSSQKIIDSMSVGTQLTVTGVYKNTAQPSNYWYRVKTAEGKSGFVYSARATGDREYITDDVVITGENYPADNHPHKVGIQIQGQITSLYNSISTVKGEICSDNNTAYVNMNKTETVNGKFFSLDGSGINSEMKFKELQNGGYIYGIDVNFKTYYSVDGTTLKSETLTKTLLNKSFNVVQKDSPPSNVSIAADKASYILGETVTITPSALGATYYAISVWDGGSYGQGNKEYYNDHFTGSVQFTPTKTATYAVQCEAFNENGSVTVSSSFTVVPEFTLSASVNADSEVTLEWTYPEWSGYWVLYRNTEPTFTSANRLTSISEPNRSWTDKGTEPGTTYYYRLSKLTAESMGGGYSNVVEITTPNNWLSARVNSDFDVTLEWTYPEWNGYWMLYRNTEPTFTSANRLTSISGPNRSWTDKGTLPGTTYYYKLQKLTAESMGGGYSNVIEITTPDYRTVTFDANGGTCDVVRVRTVNGGADVVFPIPTWNETHRFVGWFRNRYYSGDVSSLSGLTSDITLYAHWALTVDPGTKVVFDPQGGTLEGPALEAMLSGINDCRDKGELIAFDWEGQEIETNVYGHEIAVGPDGVVTARRPYGEQTKLTVPVGGFVLSGHNSGSNGAAFVCQIDSSDRVVLDHATGMIYVFRSENAYNGFKYVEENETYGPLPVPVRNEYNFDGWFTADGTEITENDVFSVAELFAHWSKITPEQVFEIITQPSDFYGASGDTINIPVVATGEGLTYTWYFKNKNDAEFRLSNVTGSTYTASLSSKTNGRTVYVVVTDVNGETVTSETATIHIGTAPSSEPAVPLAITTQPTDAYGASGATVTVSVEAQGDGLEYAWYYKNRNDADFTRSTVTGSEYSITLTSKKDGRQIYCVITDSHGASVTSDTATIRIGEAPLPSEPEEPEQPEPGNPLAITTQPADAYGASGATVTVSVEAQGEGLEYAWYYKNRNDAGFTRSTVTGSEYSITLTSKKDGRQIYCVITDSHGASVTSDTATIYIGEAPTEPEEPEQPEPGNPLAITTQPADAYGASGATVTVSVEAQGEGLEYAWYYKNRNDASFTRSTVTGSEYSIALTSKKDGRQVYCVVTDASGASVTSDTATIHIGAAPEPPALAITTQPADAYGASGATVTVSVIATGEGLTYTWYYKNKNDADFTLSTVTGSEYSIQLSSKKNGRQVYCVVTDFHGATVTSDTATIRIG